MRGVFRRFRLALTVGDRQRFAVLRIGIGLGFVPRGLTGLGQQDQGGGIGRLQAESQVEQDERVGIEVGDAEQVQAHPDHHDQCLCA
ncbi:hypothetical protein D3C75_1151060 [compost metagenome]